MAVPKMTRHEMKQDDLVNAIERTRRFAASHQALVRNIALGAALLVALGIVAWVTLSARASAADALLREAQTRFSAPVVKVGANPAAAAPSYTTAAERDRAALDSFDQLVGRYGRRIEGRIGRFYQGILLGRLGREEEAVAALRQFVRSPSSPLLGATAQAHLAHLLAKRGELEEASGLFTELAGKADGLYPADWALFYLGDTLDRQGKKAEADSAYQRILTEFPASVLTPEAERRTRS